jgi:hypothetical protein
VASARSNPVGRAILRSRMRETWHMLELRVEELLDAWAAEAKERGLSLSQVGYWRYGEEWIREQSGSQR